jgi:methyltransferase (TIGR00027 family)
MTENATTDPSAVRNISDTALWVAVYRARETERPDAAFLDPFARRLAGARGEAISGTMPALDRELWSFTARTLLFDRYIEREVQQGADMVINLAAGLDARPYRMSLPPALKWIEVDLPGTFDYKERILAGERPVCALERVRLDLADVSARRALFEDLGSKAARVLIVSEGLLIYLATEEVAALAEDLARVASFQRWAFDLQSPGLLRMAQRATSAQLSHARATMKFAPAEGPPFFERYGWKPIEVGSFLKEGARLKRLRFSLRLVALLPESNGAQGSRPWSAACLCAKK